jgi:hypothetical protein
MRFDTKIVRDPFTFSLRGTRAANAYVPVPAIADDRVNRSWDARLGRASRDRRGFGQPPAVHRIENLLARYFAPGCCDAS